MHTIFKQIPGVMEKSGSSTFSVVHCGGDNPLSLPTAKWSMVISFFSGVMASGFAFGCAKDTVEFFNAGIGEVRFPVGEGFLLVIFDYVGPWV